MSKFKRKVTKVSYSIEIPMDDFLALQTTEYETIGDALSVAEEMEKQTCACDVDYNGHFGNFIYFTFEAQDDLPEEWEKIERIITQGIKNAKRWMKKNTITRIVCNRHSEAHYSSTPDLALERCPVCDAPTTDIHIVIDIDE